MDLKTGKEVRFIWTDTIGRERFRSLVCNYIKKGDYLIFLYDITNKDMFDNTLRFFKNAKEENQNIKLVYLIGNFIDREEKREVSFEEAMEFSEENNIKFFEISVKENIGIKEFYIDLLSETMKLEENNSRIVFKKGVIKKNKKKKKKKKK